MAEPNEPPRTPPPLSRNREFILLWVGQALSQFGSRISWIAYPLLTLELTGSAAKAGLVAFANTVPAVVVGLPAGAFVDRWNRKRLMIWCDVGRAVALATIVAALAVGRLTFTQVLLIAFVERTLTVFFDPAEVGAIRQLVPSEQLTTAIARNESREYAAQLLGPPVGGVLFDIGRALPFLADALSYAASLLALVAIRTPFEGVREAPPRRLRHEVAEGLAYMWRQPFLRTTTLITAANNFVTNGVALATIVVARQTLHASSATIGLMLTVFGLGGLAGSLLAPLLQARLTARRIIVLYAGAWALVIPWLALASSVYLLGVLVAVALAVAPAVNAVIGARRIALVPDRLQGRVQSAGAIFFIGSIGLGTLASGFLLSGIGRLGTAAVFTAVMASTGMVALLVPSIRRALA
jgi:MFS family permease